MSIPLIISGGISIVDNGVSTHKSEQEIEHEKKDLVFK